MPSCEDALQDCHDISHLPKLFKVIEAVTEAVNGGVDPQRILKAIQLGKNTPSGSYPSPFSASSQLIQSTFLVLGTKQTFSAGKTQQLDINQHSFNVAAANAATACPNASSLIRGLPYHDSAQNLTNEFLEAAGQHKIKWQDERKQRAAHLATARNAKLAYDERRFLPSSDFAAVDKDLDDAMISLNGSLDQVTCGQKQPADAFTFNNILRSKVQSGEDDEWVTLNNKPALFAMPEEKQKLMKQDKDGAFESIATGLQRTHVKDFAYKDDVVDGKMISSNMSKKEMVSAPLHLKTESDAKKPVAIDKKVTDKKSRTKKATASSKKTTTAVKKSTAFDTTTNACSKASNKPLSKRRGGRPLGYRKQANGKFAFADGSTVQSKNQSSSNDGGDKKRKAPVEAATTAAGSPNGKRQRKSKGKGEGKDNEAAVNEEAVGGQEEGLEGRGVN